MNNPTVLHFEAGFKPEFKFSYKESRENKDVQRDDDLILTYEGYDVSELI